MNNIVYSYDCAIGGQEEKMHENKKYKDNLKIVCLSMVSLWFATKNYL